MSWSREFDAQQVRMVQRLYRAVDDAVQDAGFDPAELLPTGDGALLVFEDTAQAALEVARTIHERLEESAMPLPIRMAINAGALQRVDAAVGHNARYVGRAINLTVRVLDLADEGQVFVSGTAAEHLKGHRNYATYLTPLPDNPVRVKHGIPIEVYNYVSPELGKSGVLRGRSEGSDWANLFDTVVDAALYVADAQDARTDIEKHVRAGSVVPSRYHYSSDASAQMWLHRCSDPTYLHQRRTTEFWGGAGGRAFADQVREVVGSHEFDFISLGPGDGEKDSRLLSHWISAGANLIFYPYDVSLPLTARAVQTVRNRVALNGDRRALRVKAVLADFQHVDQLREVFRHRSARNVVSLMGTLGNLKNEMEMLWHLRDSMDDGDLLILEVRLQSEEDPTQTVSDDSLRHDFGPLENYLGLRFDRSCMEYLEQREVSAVPDTRTLVVSYCGDVPGFGERRVKLQYIHYYDPQAFLDKVGDVRNTGFRVLHKVIDRDGSFLECLMQRESSSL